MGAFKLGKMTFGSLFKKPETVMYPIETKPQPKGLKGHIVVVVEDCILCGMCDRSCPTDCIAVDKQAGTWSINRYSCIQCGYCTTVCPKDCLTMEPNYAPAATEIAADVFAISGRAASAKAAKADAPAKEAKADAKAEAKNAAESAKQPARDDIAAPKADDAVLEAKIGIMDPDKAERVRAALARK